MSTAFRGHLQFAAWILTAVSLVIVGSKPLLDIPGPKVQYDTVDLGMVGSSVGALFMALALGLVALSVRRLPPGLAPALAALLLLGLLSVLDLLLLAPRDEFLQTFAATGLRDIFGSYVPPKKGIVTQAAQLAVGFAPVALFAVLLLKPEWFSVEWMRWVTLLVVGGAVVHCLIAWLQVAGVVPYTFFFKLPGGNIGRASGGYFHPASLGRLLIFAVFFLYAAGDRLRLRPVLRLGVLALLVATAVVSTHRVSLLCILMIMAALEARRLPAMGRWVRGLPLKVFVAGAVAVAAVLAVLLFRFGGFLWQRGAFLVKNVGSLDVTNKDFMRGRGEIWFHYADAWGDAPFGVWLTGLGYEPWNAHSDSIRVFVVWGILGLVLMGVVTVSLWRTTSRLITVEARWVLAVLYITTAVFALTQKPTSYSYYVWLFIFGHMLLLVFHPLAEPSAVAAQHSMRPRSTPGVQA
ncbi:hypothetical protein [Micromonospora sp. CB01531]|uniref:hypothetical protein n=1 Tax=Micromonospora sp. CB01531 TaxID=1718947 RepID=UPI001160F956|nr:hypothetical protein [Micromonospora sp. CB01531]